MQFLSPALLWALAALAIPIVLHLFYFRRFRQVAFTNVRFLREVKEETQRRSRLRNLVVLALRLLAFAALVIAFAQPFIPAPGAAPRAPDRVAVVVDNSQSMAAQASEVSLLEKAKQRAREIVRAFPEATEYQLITNDLDGSSARALSRDDALAAIDDIRLSAASRTGQLLLGRVSQLPARDAGAPTPTFIISDFQAAQYDPAALAADSALALAAVPVAPVVARNVSLDTAWLASPLQLVGEPTTVLVRLTNHGTDDAEAIRVSALVNGASQPFGIKRVPAGATVTDTLVFAALPAGWAEAELAITDFPIEFDDRYFITFEVRDRLRALAISEGGAGAYLRSAFPPDGPLALELQPASRVDYSRLGDFDLVVLDGLPTLSSGLAEALVRRVRAGGKIAVFPPTGAGADAASYSAILRPAGLAGLGAVERGTFVGGRINTASFVFSDVFERLPSGMRLPTAQARYRLGGGAAETLIAFRDGDPLVVAKPLDRGIVYLSATGLDAASSDFVRNAEVFVPMLYRMAFSGTSARPLAYTIGAGGVAEVAVGAGLGERALRLEAANGSFIPAQRILGDVATLSFGRAPEQPGVYRLRGPQDSLLARVAFNYDRRESPQTFVTRDALAAAGLPVYDGEEAGTLEAALESGVLGTAWWPYLITLALLALLAEALVLRFWSTAASPPVARAGAPVAGAAPAAAARPLERV